MNYNIMMIIIDSYIIGTLHDVADLHRRSAIKYYSTARWSTITTFGDQCTTIQYNINIIIYNTYLCIIVYITRSCSCPTGMEIEFSQQMFGYELFDVGYNY